MKLFHAICLIAFTLPSSFVLAGSSENYLSKAYARYSAEMLGYPRTSTGAVDWAARRKLYNSGAMTITRPGSGETGYRSCVETDYSYSGYFLNSYLGLTPEEIRRYHIINRTLFDGPIAGHWRNHYLPNRRALLSALELKDPGVPPLYRQGVLDADTATQLRLASIYNSSPVGPKTESADTGGPIDQGTAFDRFVAWNQNETAEMGRFSFWQTMTYWAVAYGVTEIMGSMVPDPATLPVAALPTDPILKLRANYYFEKPLFALDDTGYPVPNQKFLINKINEINPVKVYAGSVPDSGSAFMEPGRAEKLQKYLVYINAPGFLYGKYYIWARTAQQKAFFDWMIFRYDPHDYGCDETKEVCWSGKDLFSFPGQDLPTTCENDFMKGKTAYQNDPASYTYNYKLAPDSKSRADNLQVLTNCYCSDAH